MEWPGSPETVVRHREFTSLCADNQVCRDDCGRCAGTSAWVPGLGLLRKLVRSPTGPRQAPARPLQEALAHEAGLHRNQVSNLERARSNREPFISDPQLSTVYRLAVALNVPPAYLLPDINTLLPKQSPELTDGSRVERNYASASVKTRTGRPTRIRSS